MTNKIIRLQEELIGAVSLLRHAHEKLQSHPEYTGSSVDIESTVDKINIDVVAALNSLRRLEAELDPCIKDAERINQLEKWTNEGYCPALIFNDNGYWALSFNGAGPLDLGEPPESPIEFTTSVEPGEWRENVRDAIDAAIENFKE